MINLYHNNEGLVSGLIEWQTVNNKGHLDADGIYLHVYFLWVHSSLNIEEVTSYFIYTLSNDERLKNVKYIYWKRGDRLSRSFKREVVLRRKNGIFKRLFTQTHCV